MENTINTYNAMQYMKYHMDVINTVLYIAYHTIPTMQSSTMHNVQYTQYNKCCAIHTMCNTIHKIEYIKPIQNAIQHKILYVKYR